MREVLITFAMHTMKRLLFIFLLLPSLECLSQTYNDRAALLEIGYGVAVPFGKFELSDVHDSSSGYATSGTNLNVIFTYMVGKKMGVSAMLSSSVNKLNETGVKNRFDLLAERLGGEFVSDIQMAKWNTTAYMAGASYIHPLQKAAFNLQLLVGYSRTEYPEVNAIIYIIRCGNKRDMQIVFIIQSLISVHGRII